METECNRFYKSGMCFFILGPYFLSKTKWGGVSVCFFPFMFLLCALTFVEILFTYSSFIHSFSKLLCICQVVGTTLSTRSISLQGKRTDNIYCQWWKSSFHAKIRILQDISASVSLTASQCFSDDICSDDKCVCIMKCISIWKLSVTQWTSVL